MVRPGGRCRSAVSHPDATVGLSPAVFHLGNLFLHVGCTLLTTDDSAATADDGHRPRRRPATTPSSLGISTSPPAPGPCSSRFTPCRSSRSPGFLRGPRTPLRLFSYRHLALTTPARGGAGSGILAPSRHGGPGRGAAGQAGCRRRAAACHPTRSRTPSGEPGSKVDGRRGLGWRWPRPTGADEVPPARHGPAVFTAALRGRCWPATHWRSTCGNWPCPGRLRRTTAGRRHGALPRVAVLCCFPFAAAPGVLAGLPACAPRLAGRVGTVCRLAPARLRADLL